MNPHRGPLSIGCLSVWERTSLLCSFAVGYSPILLMRQLLDSSGHVCWFSEDLFEVNLQETIYCALSKETCQCSTVSWSGSGCRGRVRARRMESLWTCHVLWCGSRMLRHCAWRCFWPAGRITLLRGLHNEGSCCFGFILLMVLVIQALKKFNTWVRNPKP